MKAVYLHQANLILGQLVEIKDDDYHHLVIVQRLKKSENILILNGSGSGFYSKVIEITKKILKLEITETKASEVIPRHSVLIFAPKKEALDLMIRSSVELAVKEIIIVRGEYSVEKLPDLIKVQKIVKQAIEQSNSFHQHHFSLNSLKEINFSLYESVNILDVGHTEILRSSKGTTNSLLVIGPEGGFSPIERDLLRSIPNASVISFNTNILRSPTAMIAGLGWLYGKN